MEAASRGATTVSYTRVINGRSFIQFPKLSAQGVATTLGQGSWAMRGL